MTSIRRLVKHFFLSLQPFQVFLKNKNGDKSVILNEVELIR